MNKIIDINAAIEKIHAGDTLMIGGFTDSGCPLALVYALAQRPDIKELTIISEDLGYGGLPYRQGQNALVANGQVKAAMVSYVGKNKEVMRLVDEGALELTLIPQGTLAERIRAAGAGIGAFYTPTGVGTVVQEGKELRNINGRDYLLEYPLFADAAFIKARKADKMGNCVFRYTAANFNPLMATAAKTVILEAEEIVEAGEIEPDKVDLPGIFVDYIVDGSKVVF